jgi:hypothetical protein
MSNKDATLLDKPSFHYSEPRWSLLYGDLDGVKIQECKKCYVLYPPKSTQCPWSGAYFDNRGNDLSQELAREVLRRALLEMTKMPPTPIHALVPKKRSRVFGVLLATAPFVKVGNRELVYYIQDESRHYIREWVKYRGNILQVKPTHFYGYLANMEEKNRSSNERVHSRVGISAQKRGWH